MADEEQKSRTLEQIKDEAKERANARKLSKMLDLNQSWPCIDTFRNFLQCCESTPHRIAPCQPIYTQLVQCGEQHGLDDQGWYEQLELGVSHSRFFQGSGDFGRVQGKLAKAAINVLPQVFDPEAETEPSKVTQWLQTNLPRFFTSDDDDEDD
mmetsp:Transcript_34011/g.85389  ORF Transcript_34011/g.85389 Transcript_34011/m.85389 type:complete len:153 (-) Transcript_34011:44-502(-)|eukprot:CAMPEP_0177647046 /NCGR_PEP_ID=MMETSP0447-20121125/10097_1 /TAXON_ID=0 /ORGANISM="Stygamoeba regulata, Strain BSH-02190019" /LENGTH=152 /DNA_ID=CAMNT_0019149617 /DNA_START=54 /DNA_END=512 /DNA_ORIENTATION=-